MADLAGAIIKGLATWDRKPADLYPTPGDVTQALLDFLRPSKDLVFHEPACGYGHMSRVLSAYGAEVISEDLFDRGYGKPGIDFLDKRREVVADFIVTNPPFSIAEAFIRRAWSLETPFFAMLLKATYFNSKKRRQLWRECPPMMVLPLTWRPAFLEDERGKNPIMEVSWFFWDRSYRHEVVDGMPVAVTVPLERPKVFPRVDKPLLGLMADLRDALEENAHARA